MAQFSPGAKLIFLICYSFAAISKFNSDFLLSDLSAAQALQQLQVGGFPVLKYVVWPPAAPWFALICETAYLMEFHLESGKTVKLYATNALMKQATEAIMENLQSREIPIVNQIPRQ